MRILLSQSAFGLHPSSGGHKANWALLKGLQQEGHTIKLIANVSKKELEQEKITPEVSFVPFTETEKIQTYTFQFMGVDFIAYDSDDIKRTILDEKFFESFKRWLQHDEVLPELSGIEKFFVQIASEYKPTHYFMNDATSLKISEAISSDTVRIFIIHSTEHLPFGPCYNVESGFSGTRSQAEKERLERVDSIWSVSKAIGDYAKEHGNLNYIHVPIHPLIYGEIPPSLHNWEAEFVVAINPGILKGFPILISLAKALPNVKFAAVASWNFTPHLAAEIKSLPNITTLPTYDKMDELWHQTRVLLVPTLWLEAFGLVVVEAMLRGIPVLASDQGGLVEAKLDVPYTLPVQPLVPLVSNEEINGYLVPKQDVNPWLEALQEVLKDKGKYEEVAKQSREASVAYVKGIDQSIYARIMQDAWKKKFG